MKGESKDRNCLDEVTDTIDHALIICSEEIRLRKMNIHPKIHGFIIFLYS